mgnify:FL=1
MATTRWNRRDLLKTLGGVTFGSAFLNPILGGEVVFELPDHLRNPRYKSPDRPITAVVLGAGGRGNVYAAYASKYPDELKIVGVVESIPFRRERMALAHKIPPEYQWETWEHALDIPKFADVLIITTWDHLHYGPAMKGLEMGYHLLLEKASAPTWKQCLNILEQSRRYGGIVGICHVLRYASYFRKMKEVVDSGRLGDIISIQYLEPVEHIHMSHSFVRGLWRNSEQSNPMILSKSCHDTDILRWIIGKPCRKVSSFGALTHFREEKAPQGSPPRCSDGCPVEAACPYSALQIYLRNKSWLWHLALPDHKDETILKALESGPYGKCVYRTDNDVVDHQVVNMEFEDEITASFNMEAFTHYGGRRTRIFGTKGDLFGDMNQLTITEFHPRKQETWDVGMGSGNQSAHGGGDWGLVHDFVQAVSQDDPSLLTSTIEASMESHLIGFKAEESRLKGGKTLPVKLDI